MTKTASMRVTSEPAASATSTRQSCSLVTLVTATPLALPPKMYTTYHGGTGGNVIGPVALQNASTQWVLPWKDKKLIYGIDSFIDVGGKLDVDAPDHKRNKTRTDETVNPPSSTVSLTS